ncbi:SDR family NAD(P)-dependent oxidoreductase [Chloroflexota bacterium]
MGSIENRWALVTGSSRGIGQQVAIGLAKKKCNLIIHGRKLDNLQETLELLKEYPIEVKTIEGDLATKQGLTNIIEGVKALGVKIDILYNNAAIQNKWMPVWKIPEKEWQETFQINFFSLVQLCNTFIPSMIKRGYGRVVNVTSGIKDVPNLSPYSTSKAALDKFTQDMAAELKDTNVLVNCLDPGWLKTDLGGPNADHEVTTVLPGALVPVLLEDFGPNGQRFAAQDFSEG